MSRTGRQLIATYALLLASIGCGGGSASSSGSGNLPTVAGAWVFNTPQALIEANLSQDASGNVTASKGQIAAIATPNAQWIFGDCLANDGGMEQDSFQGTINPQGVLNGTYYEGLDAWTVSATFAAPESEQHTLTGTISPVATNTCTNPSSGEFSGSTAFPTLNLSHTYSGQITFIDGTRDTLSLVFQESSGTLTANMNLSGTDNGSATLTGYTVGSAIYLAGTFNGGDMQYWGLILGGGVPGDNEIILYDQEENSNVGTLE